MGFMSTARSRITGMFFRGWMRRVPSSATLSTWVRQVQRGLPFTVMAQDPQTPTRQAKR
jgi:hypothetical protein